jgi:hypothetical protein
VKRYLLFILYVAGLILVGDFTAAKLTWHPDFRGFHPTRHHGLRPLSEASAVWGPHEYSMRINELGMKDHAARKVALKTDSHRIVVLGDSFTEGIGFDHEDTFVGQFARKIRSLTDKDVDVLNAGVVSYSPKLYLLTAQDLVTRIGLKVDEFIVFVDISDIYDELVYEDYTPSSGHTLRDRYYRTREFLNRNSFLYRVLLQQPVHDLLLFARNYFASDRPATQPTDPANTSASARTDRPARADWDNARFSVDRARARWTFDETVFALWGKYGAELAQANIRRLLEFARQRDIRISLVVYPWPDQLIHEAGTSRQESIWRQFSKANGMAFLNLFAAFEGTEKSNFVDGDVHWNAAGHTLVANRLTAFWCAHSARTAIRCAEDRSPPGNN